jgi:putative transposase
MGPTHNLQRDEHLMMVLRYVLQNPVRAGLSGKAGEWRWSSLQRPQLVDPWLIEDDQRWTSSLDAPMREAQLTAVRESENWQRPFGKSEWRAEMASIFGVASTLRPRGRPRTEKKSSLSPFPNHRLLRS